MYEFCLCLELFTSSWSTIFVPILNTQTYYGRIVIKRLALSFSKNGVRFYLVYYYFNAGDTKRNKTRMYFIFKKKDATRE